MPSGPRARFDFEFVRLDAQGRGLVILDVHPGGGVDPKVHLLGVLVGLGDQLRAGPGVDEAAEGQQDVSAEQASSTGTFNPAQVFLIGGALLAPALVWFVRPVRAAAVRLVTWRGNS